MSANVSEREKELVDAGVTWLRGRLPSTWSVERSQRVLPGGTAEAENVIDGAVDIRASTGTFTTFAVEARASLAPREVDQLLPRLSRVLRTLSHNVPILVIAPWLSARTRELLAAERINFIDLTGNALIRLDHPALFLNSVGATRNPQPDARGDARARGAKAARLIRLLIDVRPPYRVQDLARAAQLTPGYVSRLLETLDREALVDRGRRGQVESVDVAGLVRRWAESYDVFNTNTATSFVDPSGGAAAALRGLQALADTSRGGRVAVTGSFAAVRLAPVAAPALLVAYCDDDAAVAQDLSLLPAGEGGNVVLLRPFDSVVWEGLAVDERNVQYVAPSQVAVDCLTGTGRMPAEGQAIVEWMTADELRWRHPSLDRGRTIQGWA